MRRERTFAEEARAMEFVINNMYSERKYLEECIATHDRDKDKVRLQMINHFIDIYEHY